MPEWGSISNSCCLMPMAASWSHPREKEMQRYFHRNGSSKGDVVDFISENLYHFNKVGRNQWEVIGKVMADFANMPVIDNRVYDNSLGAIAQEFNPKRYVGESISTNADYAMGILKDRGLTQETIDLFSSHISIVRDKHNKYGLPMIGFPYREPDCDKLVGYELRGDRGFKSKAAGTNSTTAMWVAGIPSALNNPGNVNRVYFCESAYDAMAFYQANRAKIDLARSAFISVGGALSNRQVSSVMDHFYLAKAVDCFDNDLAGRVYGMSLTSVVGKCPLCGDDVLVSPVAFNCCNHHQVGEPYHMSVWRHVKGHNVTLEELKEILTYGITSYPVLLNSENGSLSKAYLRLSEDKTHIVPDFNVRDKDVV